MQFNRHQRIPPADEVDHPAGFQVGDEPTVVGSFVDLATLVIACLLGGYFIGVVVAGGF